MVQISEQKRKEIVRLLGSYMSGGGGYNQRVNRERMAKLLISYLEAKKETKADNCGNPYPDIT